jgi:two-component system cell cycle response regulator DivK
VLIVDDNERNRKLSRDVLLAAGYLTLEATTAAEGMAIAIEYMPGVILLDLRLPDVDGTEVVRLFKAEPRTSNIPVVAVSAVRIDSHDDWLGEAGFAGFIQKPIDVDLLPDLILRFADSDP